MGHKSVRHSSVPASHQPVIDYEGLTDSLVHHSDHKLAANDPKLAEEQQVNPLWMITAALAVLFVLGMLLMFA